MPWHIDFAYAPCSLSISNFHSSQFLQRLFSNAIFFAIGNLGNSFAFSKFLSGKCQVWTHPWITNKIIHLHRIKTFLLEYHFLLIQITNKMVAILAVIAMVCAMVGCTATHDSLNESSTEETYVETITLHWLFH
jgi:hypothetical protein